MIGRDMKGLLKKILPPIFEDIRKAFKPVHFLGPYGTLEEAKSQVRTKAFESKAWIQNTLDKFDRVPGLKDGFFPQHQFLLSTLLSLETYRGRVKCVDLGGGAGEIVPILMSQVKHADHVAYFIMDNSVLIEHGRERLPSVTFIDYKKASPEEIAQLRDADLLFMSSVLHYIEDWEAALSYIKNELRPRQLVICRHYSPDNNDKVIYATQRIYTKFGYCGEEAITLINHQLVAEALEPVYRRVIAAVADEPDYFPKSFHPCMMRERTLTFERVV